ncbi:unnamed protein product [Anisakis simplex]|uniref:Transmembrane protein 104 homolog (inferred by orthology to a C. elegans protein) n=1 Tax=Anisakis simplex TaxID=6269 RepID=A0A0M3K1Z1_ANISI|nr:unnamed protein product [Anisakis simplex]
MIGYILTFNLIVGTGALALPKAFESAGYVLGILLLIISSFMSYVCATFVVEGMAIANAASRRFKWKPGVEASDNDLRSMYKIQERVEMSTMARLFIGKYGLLFFNTIMTVYLFGDLVVYTAAVPKSIMNVICDAEIMNDAAFHALKFHCLSQSVNGTTANGQNECHEHWPEWLQRITVYRMAIFVFVCFVTPLVLVGVQRTKFLQLSTSICRWTAFIVMIVLACLQLAKEGSPRIPQTYNIHGFGSLFGTTVYAFMCHHSLPSIVTPMKSKSHIFIYLGLVYALVLAFYLALAVSGTFAFEHIFDVYSLNFLHSKTDQFYEVIINYFLALFPVFTLTSNYPIVACTLINNLTVLSDLILELSTQECNHSNDDKAKQNGENKSKLADDTISVQTAAHSRHHIIAFAVITLSTLVALFSDDILILTSITGSYPGVGVQYIIPSLIAIYARRYCSRHMNDEVPRAVRSPFYSPVWPKLMLLWSAFTMVMVTLNFCHVFSYLP